jgi:hypothetical protein
MVLLDIGTSISLTTDRVFGKYPTALTDTLTHMARRSKRRRVASSTQGAADPPPECVRPRAVPEAS